MLDVTELCHIGGEENDAKVLFSGDVIDSYFIDIESGEIVIFSEENSTYEQTIDITVNDDTKTVSEKNSFDSYNFDLYDNESQQQTTENYVLNTKLNLSSQVLSTP